MSSNPDITEICRTCLNKSTNLTPISATLEDMIIANVVTDCTAVLIVEDEDLPNHICRECLMRLAQFVCFVQKTRKTDQELRRMFKKRFEDAAETLDGFIDIETIKVELYDEYEPEAEGSFHDHEESHDSVVKFTRPKKSGPKKRGRKAKPKLPPEPAVLDELEKNTFDTVTRREDEFICCSCFQTFTALDDLEQHGKVNHRKDLSNNTTKTHICEICFRRYATQKAVKDHKEKFMLIAVYECKICQFRCANATRRRTHAQNHNKKPFTVSEDVVKNLGKICCAKFCNESFPTEELLIKHALTAHKINQIEANLGLTNKDRHVQCDRCYMKFYSEQALAKHRIRKYLPKRHQCSICGEKFFGRADLVLHERIHRNEKNFRCEICPKRFYTAYKLTEHLRRTHGTKPKYACNLCDKAFKQKQGLHAHMFLHEGRLPFVCEVCNKAFRWKTKMVYHMRTHTGERPFPCKYCDAAFADQTNRMRHELIHLKDKNR